MRSAPIRRPVALARVVLAGTLAWCGGGVALAQAPTAVPGTPVVEGPAPVPPTPLEQAVIEHACRVPGQAMLTAEAYDACLGEQLAGLRVEFGKDLKKLSAAERRTIDRACTALRAERGRDAYVACLDQRLTALVIARGRTRPAVSLVPPQPVPVADPVVSAPAAVATMPMAAANRRSSVSMWVGLIVMIVAAAGGYGVWKSRQKPGPLLCRVCGELANAGDLCAGCRHELAEHQRRAAAERTEQAQSVAEAARRAQDEADARQRDAQPPPVDVPRRHAHEAEVQVQAQIQAQADETGRRREADHQRWQEAAAATISDETVVTPQAVLGVAPDATAEQIRAAYDAAQAKYAAEQVAHLGVELQDHYRRKREAAAHAFEVLSPAVPAHPSATTPA